MRKVTYSMNTSADGYIVDPDGEFGWTALDEEVFRCWIDDFVADQVGGGLQA